MAMSKCDSMVEMVTGDIGGRQFFLFLFETFSFLLLGIEDDESNWGIMGVNGMRKFVRGGQIWAE